MSHVMTFDEEAAEINAITYHEHHDVYADRLRLLGRRWYDAAVELEKRCKELIAERNEAMDYLDAIEDVLASLERREDKYAIIKAVMLARAEGAPFCEKCTCHPCECEPGPCDHGCTCAGEVCRG